MLGSIINNVLETVTHLADAVPSVVVLPTAKDEWSWSVIITLASSITATCGTLATAWFASASKKIAKELRDIEAKRAAREGPLLIFFREEDRHIKKKHVGVLQNVGLAAAKIQRVDISKSYKTKGKPPYPIHIGAAKDHIAGTTRDRSFDEPLRSGDTIKIEFSYLFSLEKMAPLFDGTHALEVIVAYQKEPLYFDLPKENWE